jgi:tetratricopeptide (TPR) repeat protein
MMFLSFPLFAQTGGSAGQTTAVQTYRTGRNLESNGRMAEAEFYYNETVRMCQDEVSRNAAGRYTYAAVTWALQRQRKYRDVISWGERGLRLYSDEYRVIETMGEAYFYLDDYNRSLNFMQRYTNAFPQGERSGVAYFFIGEIYRLTGRNRHADIAYTTAVRLDPNTALWWYRLATVREAAGKDTGEYAPAIEAYQRALRLNPNYSEANTGLARVRNTAR